MTRAGMYIRISADKEGRELGVKRQEQDARALAKRKGWEVVGVYQDNDISAVKQRPEWNRLLADIEAGKVDAVVAYSSSRLYRDVDNEKGRLFQACQSRKEPVTIETVVSGMIDPYTADGRMLANILASIDQGERERVSERAKRKRAEKAANGEFLGGYRPFGFQPEGKHLIVNEPEAKLIRRASTDILNGVALSSVARRWNDRGVTTTGGKPWTKGHVNQVLAAERNVPDILTATDRARIVKMFDGRRTGKAADRYLLSGLLECGVCGGRVQGRGGKYVCVATGALHLSAVARPVNDTVLEAAAERPGREAREVHDPSEKLVQQREKLVREQEALGEDPPKGWSEARVSGRDRKLTREIAEIDRQLEESRPRGEWSELYRKTEEFDERVWLESLVERVTLRPASKGANRFDPERVEVSWR